jgi:hypothetical protein
LLQIRFGRLLTLVPFKLGKLVWFSSFSRREFSVPEMSSSLLLGWKATLSMPPVHCCCVGILLAVLSSLPQSAIQSFKKTSSNDDRLYSRKRFPGESSASKRPDRINPIWKIGSIRYQNYYVVDEKGIL